MGMLQKPIKDIDYRIGVFNTLHDQYGMIVLLSGPYKGTVYQYDRVGIREETQIDSIKLSYHFTILHNRKFQDDLKFHRYAGDVLTSILTDSIEYKIGNLNGSQLTENNTSIISPR